MHILVIDDLMGSRYIARDVIESGGGRHTCVTASTYEEAVTVIEGGGIDAVLTDMFFPGEKNLWDLFTEEEKQAGRDACLDRDVRLYEDPQENPSGLGIVLICREMSIPCLIVSDGNRHFGELGLVRYAADKKYGVDLVYKHQVYSEFEKMDRRDYSAVWRDAVKQLEEGRDR